MVSVAAKWYQLEFYSTRSCHREVRQGCFNILMGMRVVTLMMVTVVIKLVECYCMPGVLVCSGYENKNTVD